ncbi:MAG TPA: hypothetical protein VNZ64_02885 [Candidatus Acidoferrum sp.]|jgi:hypothetical protein|nr:hypothetical protein [Candidatus Acidoferrum sp.]
MKAILLRRNTTFTLVAVAVAATVRMAFALSRDLPQPEIYFPAAKLSSLIAAVALATSFQSITASAQVITNSGPIPATNLASAPNDSTRLPYQRANTNLLTNAIGGLRGHNLAAGERTRTANWPSWPLTPGAYKTAPYACIVIVPDKNLDDCCVVAPAECDSRMPVVTPELRLVPLRSK